jgi:flavoprotein
VTDGRPILHLVVCAAPPATRIDELVRHAHADGWTVCLIPTPVAATWLDVRVLEELTAHPVRSRARRPDETRLPPADAVAVVPATFNTINKCAAGINDNAALGVVNEAIGLGLPVVVGPYVKPALAAHPAFARALRELTGYGFIVLPTNAIHLPDSSAIAWHTVLNSLPAARPASEVAKRRDPR